MLPKVSVIIPTYNRAGIVERAIRSALAQTYPNVGIIVVDDGSTDDTRAVVSQYAGVHYLYKTNGGQGSARNAGLKQSSGEFVATLDSDDEWFPGFVETLVNLITAHQLDFAFCNWQQQTAGGNFYNYLEHYIGNHCPYLSFSHDSQQVLSYEHLRKIYTAGCISPSSALLFRRSILHEWNEEMRIGDDWCLLLDLVLRSKPAVGFTTEQLWTKRIQNNNIYDGRNRYEVNELLYISDIPAMTRRFDDVLSESEKKHFASLYARALVACGLDYPQVSRRKRAQKLALALTADPQYLLRTLQERFVASTRQKVIKMILRYQSVSPLRVKRK